MPEPDLIIHDANVLIALIQAGVFDRCLTDLARPAVTTDLVLAELTDPQEQAAARQAANKNRLIVRSLTPDELLQVAARSGRGPAALSLPDHSVLWLAQATGGTILSGDGPMRRHAEAAGIPLHGLLWLLDRMADAGWSPTDLHRTLSQLLEHGNRLPHEATQLRLRKWS